MSVLPTTVPSKTLAQNLSSSGTTLYLNNSLSWDGVQLSSADFGTALYAVLRNAANTQLEIISLDPATVTSANTITILARGLPYNGDTTANTETKYDWPASTTIVELGADTPQLLAQLVEEAGAETIAGVKTFSSIPKTTGGNPTDDTELARKAYVDSVVVGGAVTYNRVVVAGNAGATVTAGQLVYLDVADGEWKLCDADTAASVENIILGLAQGAGTDGNPITSGVLLFGLDSNQTGLTTNTKYFASNTAGGIATSAGTTEVSVGISRSTTSILFWPRFDQQLTEDLQDALAGSSGTPSGSNKFVTAADAVVTPAASKIVRAGTDSFIESGFIGTNKKIYISTTEVTFTDGNGGAGAGSEQTLFSTTIPGGLLSTNNGIHFKIYIGAIDMAQAAASYTFKVKYGAATQLTLSNGASPNDMVTTQGGLGGYFEGYILADGATNTQKITGVIDLAQNDGENAADTSVGVSKHHMFGTAAGAIDSTANQTLAITLTQTNNPANDCVVEWCIVESIR